MSNEMTTIPQSGMTTDEILWQKKRVAELMTKVLKDNEHYGIIPGTKKKTLYKSGAEVIALTFGIHPEMDIRKTDLPNGHREYEVTCKMFRNSDGMALASGVGSCSSMESKYRWRTAKKFNPETKKQEEFKVENPNIEDLFNTVLKMAKKRAFVDAVITATAASDFVTQDLEDYAEVEQPAEPWEAEIDMIDTLDGLKKYYEENKGKGARFDQAILKRKNILEANIKQDENSSDDTGVAGVVQHKKGKADSK